MRPDTPAGSSWSAQFGDTDNDSGLDLWHDPRGVRPTTYPARRWWRRISRRNRRRQPLSGGSRVGAGATQRGRGMVVADLNLDDDFDCRDQQLPPAPRRYRLCCGAGLQVDLRWARSATSFAIGSGPRAQH